MPIRNSLINNIIILVYLGGIVQPKNKKKKNKKTLDAGEHFDTGITVIWIAIIDLSNPVLCSEKRSRHMTS